MKDRKTTAFGLVTAIGALCTLVLAPWLDGDPATAPRWAEFVPLATAAIGFLFAADSAKPADPKPPA